MFGHALKKGSVELLVLALLLEEERHGYEIGKLIEQRSGGRLQFQISSLYPILCRMESKSWIEGRWVEKPGERRRKFYRLTARGEEALRLQKERWDEFARGVRMILEASHA